MTKKNNTRAQQQSLELNPALEPLTAFVGDWDVELKFPTDPPGTTRGSASFEWVEGGAFLMYRLGDRAAGSPFAVHVIGRDDSAETYALLYSDDRGVSRIYQMSFEGNEWKQWRDTPGFSQRFMGTFSADRNRIVARWEKSKDGKYWEHDFDLTYTRIK